MLSIAVILLLSYLVGSIPGSVWSSKLLYGVDVREHGSHNAGATNTFRVVGWKAGALSTVVDMGKGALAAGGFAQWIRLGPVPAFGGWDAATILGLLAGLAAVFGHMFPIFAGFKGGKGVNTAAGILLALTPLSTLLTMAVFLTVLLTSHYVSLASMVGAVSFPLIVAVRRYVFDAPESLGLLLFGIVVAVAIVAAHQSNIKRLLNGTENRVGSFKPAQGMHGRGELS
jgi:glycerol-3-phosphate acyltransferase PlsY